MHLTHSLAHDSIDKITVNKTYFPVYGKCEYFRYFANHNKSEWITLKEENGIPFQRDVNDVGLISDARAACLFLPTATFWMYFISLVNVSSTAEKLGLAYNF